MLGQKVFLTQAYLQRNESIGESVMKILRRKKDALILLALAIPALSFAVIKFEFSGVSNTGLAVAISISGVFGLLGVIGSLIMLFTKNQLGIFDVKEPETKKEKLFASYTPISGEIDVALREEELRNLVEGIPEESWTETIDDKFNKLRAKATRSDKSLQEFIKEKKMVKTKKEKPVEKSGSESIGLMKREKELIKRANELTTLISEVETELNQVRENLETKGWVTSKDGWVIE